MKSKFTYAKTNIPIVDRALDNVAQAFARVDQPDSLAVVRVTTAEYRAVGNEDLIVVNRTCKVYLPSPSRSWHTTVVQGAASNSVTIACVSPAVSLDGKSQGSVELDTAYSSAQVFTDGTEYYVVGGSAAAPPVPPIPPFPPVIPPGPPSPPATVPWFASLNFGGALTGDSSGTETWQGEEIVDFSGAPASASLYWWFQSLSTAGTGTLRIRIGGSAYRALDGAVASTAAETSSTMASHSVSAPTAGLSGVKRVTLTAQSSGAGQKVQIQGMNAQFR